MLRLQLLFVATGAVIGALSPYVAVMLQSRGLDPTAIGIVVALGAVATTAGVPAWGHVGDGILGRARALRLAAILAALAALGLAVPGPAVLFAVLIVVLTPFQATFLSLADALAVNAVADVGRQYGRIRYWSSLAFAVVATVSGFVFDRTGYGPAPFLFAAIAALLAVVAAGIPDVPRVDLHYRRTPDADPASTARPPAAFRRRRFGSMGLALEARPRLWAVMLAIVLVYLGVIGGWTFLTLRIVELGGQPSDVALSAGVGAFAEIPGMLLAGRIASRIGLRGLFVGSVALYGLCFASWMVLADTGLIIATRALAGIGLSGLWVGSVLTMATLLPDRLQATGQALYQISVFGVAAAVANLAGGWIYAEAGYAAVFGIAVAGAVASVVVGWFALPRRNEEARLRGRQERPARGTLEAPAVEAPPG